MSDADGLAWGRAGYEPAWVVWLNRLGVVVCALGACNGKWWATLGGIGVCVTVGCVYLCLTFRALRLGYVQPAGVISLAAYRDRRRHVRIHNL